AGLAAEERRRLRLDFADDHGDAPTGLVGRPHVGAGLAQAASDRVADRVRHLAPAGRIEERKAALQRAEAPAYGGWVKRQGGPRCPPCTASERAIRAARRSRLQLFAAAASFRRGLLR